MATARALIAGALAAAAAVAGIAATSADHAPADDMVWVPGGRFAMGCDGCGLADAQPAHVVELDGFWMDRTPVTNDQFARFVAATGYLTRAERAADHPAGSAVFSAPQRAVSLEDPRAWWRYVPGASWKHPEGPGSSLRGRGRHPVVHVAHEDALAYARWAGKRLPTEAEFEYAARGGLEGKRYAWGDELRPGGRAAANTWQGAFPYRDEGSDGYRGTSPVAAFPPNGFGLHDMGGNVWQWCSDWYDARAYAARGGATRNPPGPAAGFDPDEPAVAKRVVRGGSYLCSQFVCTRYLVGSRGRLEPTSTMAHLGFRLVRSGGDARL